MNMATGTRAGELATMRLSCATPRRVLRVVLDAAQHQVVLSRSTSPMPVVRSEGSERVAALDGTACDSIDEAGGQFAVLGADVVAGGGLRKSLW